MNSTTQIQTSQTGSPARRWGTVSGAIELTDSGKRFNRDWIFRHVNYRFETGRSYAITGPNGSGKSTLLQAIAGSLHLSEGQLTYHGVTENEPPVEQDQMYRYISLAAPYLELIEEMTAREFLTFHGNFKPLDPSVNIEGILDTIGLSKAMDKQIRYFSSGMKQRIKLAQAIFSDVPVLLLDEPCTNLDKPGYDLYHSLIHTHGTGKLIIVSSNDANEMDFCTERISILDYK